LTKMAQWEKNLYASWIAQLLAIIGFSASVPFIPLYLIKDLGIHDQAGAELWAGVMATTSGLAMAIFAPIWGVLSDRFGRKSMVLRAMLGGFVIIGLMPLFNNVWIILVLRIAQGVLTGTVPANVALIASTTPPRRLGFALGLMQTAVFTGSSVGPLIGGFCADITDYKVTFFITAILLLIAGLIVLFFVKEDFVPQPKVHTEGPKPSLAQRMRGQFSSRTFVAMLVVLTLVQFGGSVVAPVLALFIQQLNGSIDGAATLAGLELAVTGIAAAASSVVAGNLADRFGRKQVLIISSLAVGILYAPQAAVTTFWQLLILRGLMGIFVGGIMPAANAIIAELIPEGRKGTAYGLVSAASSMGFAVGPITGSIIAAALDIRGIFLLTSATLLLAAFWTWWAVDKYEPTSIPESPPPIEAVIQEKVHGPA
jgi:DHA1 family multidrug resistance protein-like MFS transporter